MSSKKNSSKSSFSTKLFSWLGKILIAFVATYITATLTKVIPPPEDVLCKLSIGYCPEPELVSILATDPDFIKDPVGVGQAPGIDQIGMIQNNVVANVPRPNSIKYIFKPQNSGKYQLKIYYASLQSRPVEIYVNGNPVSSNALSRTTVSWNNDDRIWSDPFEVELIEGENEILIKRGNIFPHISKLQLLQLIQ